MRKTRDAKLPVYLPPTPPPQATNSEIIEIERIRHGFFGFGTFSTFLLWLVCLPLHIPCRVIETYAHWALAFSAEIAKAEQREARKTFLELGRCRPTRVLSSLLCAYLLAQHTRVWAFADENYGQQKEDASKIQASIARIREDVFDIHIRAERLLEAPGLWHAYSRNLILRIKSLTGEIQKFEARVHQPRSQRNALHSGTSKFLVGAIIFFAGHLDPSPPKIVKDSRVGRIAGDWIRRVLGPAKDPEVDPSIRWIWVAQLASGAKSHCRTCKALRNEYDKPYDGPLWQRLVDHVARMKSGIPVVRSPRRKVKSKKLI